MKNELVVRIQFDKFLRDCNKEINEVMFETLIGPVCDTLSRALKEDIDNANKLLAKVEQQFKHKPTKEELKVLSLEITNYAEDKYVNVKESITDRCPELLELFKDKIVPLTDKVRCYGMASYQVTKRKYYKQKAQLLVNETINRYCDGFVEIYISCQEELRLLLLDISLRFNGLCSHLFSDEESTSENEELPSLESIDSKVEIVKMFNYKHLNKLASSYGFKYDRQSGSHAQFINETTGKVITIPQGRDIGKGLSYKIQKDILEAK